MLNAPLAKAVVGREESAVVFRLAGNMESVAAQRAALVELGQPFDVSPDAWTTLRAVEPPAAIVFRLSRQPSEIGATWDDAGRIVHGIPGALLHATPSRGVVRVIVPNVGENIARLTTTLAVPVKSKRIGERMPQQLWAAAFPSRSMSGIGGRLKQAFDPRGVLNPGILGDAT